MCINNNIGCTIALLTIVLIGCKEQRQDAETPVKNEEIQSSLAVPDKYVYAKLEDVNMKGAVGKELDRMVEKRIASDFAANEIAPEATKAFEIRMDDQFHKGRGLWQGEFWGKWMLSAVAAYRYSGDERIKRTIKKETDRLLATQDENGYIGSYQNSAFVKGNVWNVWNRKYALWGLVETYELLKDPAVLEAARGMMDHLMTEVGPGKAAIVDTGNFYGLPSSSILTPLVKLYLNTGEKKYLNYAEYIVDNWHSVPGTPPYIVQKGITGAPVHLWFPEKGKWTKAYEFISCVEGLIDLYQVTGNENYIKASKNIYKAIQENERVITGGIGYHDKLVGASLKPEGLNEPCDVVYWERLSAKLLTITGDQAYADEIERLTYNILLGSFNLEGNWGVRRMGLNEPHLVSPLHAFTKYHQCCVANVPRGMLQLGEVTVMSAKDQNQLLVNLYIPGNYAHVLADGHAVDLRVETDYPKTGDIRIVLDTEKSFNAVLAFRVPDWCQNFSVSVDGKEMGKLEGSSMKVEKKWQKGDVININMEVGQRIIEIPDENNFKALMWGPVVLARSSILESKNSLDTAINFDGLKVVPVSEPKQNENIWMQFQATNEVGTNIKLCDYASTGREYEIPTDPTAWEAMIKNRVNTDQRVWIKAE